MSNNVDKMVSYALLYTDTMQYGSKIWKEIHSLNMADHYYDIDSLKKYRDELREKTGRPIDIIEVRIKTYID